MSEPSELTEALAAVQKRVQSIGTNQEADAGKYKYKYADLASIIAKVYPIMAENGLAWTALPTMSDGRMVLRYQLRHKSGEVLEGMYPLATHGTPQQMGSEISYARRYTFSAVIGIATEEDDDGKRASEADRPAPGQIRRESAAKQRAERKSATSQGPLTPEIETENAQRRKYHAMRTELGWDEDAGHDFIRDQSEGRYERWSDLDARGRTIILDRMKEYVTAQAEGPAFPADSDG